ncbi:SDR family oxidoreductase [Oceanibacterium hippocampi]|uniref:3-oxoacyl-[acyl-carrier-protein] reductase FabG n=1 Tax=Oceanibacterium hippocampi TaxID=745714 RepID=A0A1Y5TH16_9PROT|nr:SDR family oxidoreductase [Oceanibacterium hippocampi]SLN63477.1 3-oxoacyl-[acyl-carrier-protein] reductase FabG [Oceanibacterium hippocampi]
MDLGLKDRVAVVTGGTSGIGLEAARILLGEGARVAICGRDGGRLDAAAATLGFDDRLLAMRCDVLDEGQVGAFRAAVVDRFGAVDMLINNAGQGRVSTFADTGDAAWEEELHLKFFSVIRPTRAFLPALENSSAGSIVVVNSLLSRQPEPHMVCTSAARAGVQNLVKSLSVEFAPRGVRVNSILLGVIVSGQWRRRFEAARAPGRDFDDWIAGEARIRKVPLGRFGQPDEPARAVVFLASPAASYITGAALEVSGGVSRHA